MGLQDVSFEILMILAANKKAASFMEMSSHHFQVFVFPTPNFLVQSSYETSEKGCLSCLF
jgi:hypothetical protein